VYDIVHWTTIFRLLFGAIEHVLHEIQGLPEIAPEPVRVTVSQDGGELIFGEEVMDSCRSRLGRVFEDGLGWKIQGAFLEDVEEVKPDTAHHCSVMLDEVGEVVKDARCTPPEDLEEGAGACSAWPAVGGWAMGAWLESEKVLLDLLVDLFKIDLVTAVEVVRGDLRLLRAVRDKYDRRTSQQQRVTQR
jgi:hypothetical protein